MNFTKYTLSGQQRKNLWLNGACSMNWVVQTFIKHCVWKI